MLYALLAPIQADAASGTDSRHLECGSDTLEILSIPQYEDQIVQVTLFDATHKEKFPRITWAGDFVSLCHSNAFLLLDTSSHHTPSRSFLMTTAPKVAATFEFGEIATFGTSANEKLFWVQTLTVKDGRPVTTLRVYSYTGERVLQNEYLEASTAIVRYEGREYRVQVIQPDYPG
jgi:hypothetical protein